MKKVVIIGAGPAGLTAAHTLLADGTEYEVIVLERSGAIGGISKTVCHNGNRMDIGGHRFFSKADDVVQWWLARLPLQGAPAYDDRLLSRPVELAEGGPDPAETDRVMLHRNRVSRIFYRSKFFDYPISMKLQTIRNMGFLQTMRAGFSYLGSAVKKLPETSLENFYINRFGRVLYRMFFEGYTEKLWGRHPREISAEWGAQRVKGLSIRAILKDILSRIFLSKQKRAATVETSLIESFLYPKLGPGQLWETVADEVRAMGGAISLHTEAVSLSVDGARISGVTCRTPDGLKTIAGDYVLSSMPIKDLVAGMPDVPEAVQSAASGLPYRDFVTVGLLVERLRIRNETQLRTLANIVPDCWIYVQDVGVRLGRIQIFNNWSPYMVKDPEHTVWIGLEYFCQEGDAFWTLSEEECVRFAVGELMRMGVLDENAPVLDAHRERVQKAYPAYFDTYDEMPLVEAYLNTFENLFCIGRNGQHRYNNMDHSMVTAFEAVKNIRAGVAAKDNVWNVNTEQNYHEEKQR